MSSLFARDQEDSLLKPACIGDLAPEVLRKCFAYLVDPISNWGLALLDSVYRAFRPVALDVLRSSARFEESREFEVKNTRFIYS
jgi:hypothetical protein